MTLSGKDSDSVLKHGVRKHAVPVLRVVQRSVN